MPERLEAARRFVLHSDQIRYYTELTEPQMAEVSQYWGKIPPYTDYIYAVKRDGGVVWDRKRIAELHRR